MADTGPSDPLLAVEDIHTYYGESYVLQGVSLAVAPGRCLALLGRNGAGKTTTLRSIVGLTPCWRGRIVFNGASVAARPTHRIIRGGVSFVPENRGIFGSLTVREHFGVARWARGGVPDTVYTQTLEMFPRLSERMDHLGGQLSGGEQQMLAIARALLARPKLLILDEPSEGLAPIIVNEVRDALLRIKAQGTAILLVEQNAPMALSVADSVTVLAQGMVQFTGTPAELDAAPEVKQVHMGL